MATRFPPRPRLAASAKIYRLANAYNYLGGSRVGKKSTAPLSPGSKPQLASLLQVSSRMTMTHEISFEFSRQSNGAAVASATQSRPKRQRGGIISPIRQGHMALAWRNNLRHSSIVNPLLSSNACLSSFPIFDQIFGSRNLLIFFHKSKFYFSYLYSPNLFYRYTANFRFGI